MVAASSRSARARRTATILGVTTALTACATGPSGDVTTSEPMFKAQMGDISGGIAPGPHAFWYVQRQPVSYVKIGVATWRSDRSRHGLRAWLDRLLGRRAAPSPPTERTALAAASLGLPVPSRVQVTNLATGATITVRIDDKAPMAPGIVQLPTDAARDLGADPARTLLVRVRYLAPVMAYSANRSLRYALRGPHAPPVPALSPPPVLVQARPVAPLPIKPPAIIPAAAIQPAPVLAPTIAEVARELRPAQPPPARADTDTRAVIRIQVGAFANLANARRAVNLLRPAGQAAIEPVRHGALTLYRVVIPAPGEPRAVERLRARVAEIGFADARLIHPL